MSLRDLSAMPRAVQVSFDWPMVTASLSLHVICFPSVPFFHVWSNSVESLTNHHVHRSFLASLKVATRYWLYGEAPTCASK